MSSTEQAAFEAAIVDACTKHKEAHWKEPDYRACVFIGTKYFIKFGDPGSLCPEIATQSYISEYAEAHADTPRMPRIPKVIHHFRDQGKIYFIMEYIKLTDSPPDLSERIAEALRWLARVPAPLGHVFGPLGGGRIRHGFFKDHKAPLLFSSIEALERYMNKGRTMLSSLAKQRVQPVRISGERLIFMQPDMHASNFGVDEHGNTVLLDFGEIAMLPESFAVYTMSSNNNLAAIAKSLGWSSSSNVASMAAISSCLWMASDTKLGLNEDGYPKTSSSKQ